jgi:protein-S-isoprenylcysteine O-methyltransferase Ste14
MDKAHWLLLIFWIAYCTLHSVFADIHFKNQIQRFMGLWFKYYRPLYSIFAAITLILILWFQFSFYSWWLFKPTFFLYTVAVIIAFAGFCIMLICINKYFYELSGLQAIQHSKVKNTLQQSGLHKYVRHPLYLGTLLFIWGLFFNFPLVSNLIAVTIITTYVLIGIKLEEKKLYLEYCESYIKYSKNVPKLIPHIFTIKKGSV